MNFINTLTPLQWVLLALVPPLIVSLYFLKLKRQPLEVPSTYLWSRTIEDLHVNSIWQRLRQSLLLLLQLLVIALVILALVRPHWKGAELVGDRFIFLVDNSASMSSTDVDGRSRLEEAKRRVGALIEEMRDGESAMIVSFSDVANVEQPFTENRRQLKRQLDAIEPTNRATDPMEALRYASGLANPGRTATDATDVQVAEAEPATLYLFSDGGFSPIQDFSLGNLEPVYVPVGSDSPSNVGIASFAVEQNPERPEESQAFARLENGGVEDAEVQVDLYYNNEAVDAVRELVLAGDGQGVVFNLPPDMEAGVLRAEIVTPDHLADDNVAFAPINPPRRARMLIVTPGNAALEFALSTEVVQRLAEISLAKPAVLESEAFKVQSTDGSFDLIVFDQCAPKSMPETNTLFIASLPPGNGWSGAPMEKPPLISDFNRVHPLMQLVDMTGVLVAEAIDVQPPRGGAKLIEADLGTLLAIAPRRGYEDVVLGFAFFEFEDGRAVTALTNWHTRRSFPVFIMNIIKYLGGSRGALAMKSTKPGRPVVIRSLAPVDQLQVKPPQGPVVTVTREALGSFVFSNTAQQGVYEVLEGGSETPAQRFAVNLFDVRETNIVPTEEVEIDHLTVAGASGSQPVRRETWKWVLLGALALLMFEWYIYNRRVYL